MTLSLYLTRRFLTSVGIVFVVFSGLVLLIDTIEQLQRFADAEVGFARALWLAALNAPRVLYQIFPMMVSLATIWLFLGMARASELVVVRGAGRSGMRMLLAPMSVAFLLGVAAVTLFNPIVAATSQRYEHLSSRLQSGTTSEISVRPEGLWLRQGGALGQTVISAERAGPDGTELFGATFLTFTADAGPVLRHSAAEARLITGYWELRDVKEWRLDSINPERESRRLELLNLPTDLTPAQIRDSFAAPASIPIWELPAFIVALDNAGLSTRQHLVWLHMELALPLMLAAMVMLGAGFTMHHSRTGRTGVRVLLAILIVFGLFFLRNFAQVLGENGQLPLLLAAWSPPLATVFLSLGLMLHLEDG